LGPGNPYFHFEQACHSSPRLPPNGVIGGGDDKRIEVKLILKGGGCENCGAQYSLPNKGLNAERDIDGVKRCILDAVLQAQGKGCGPGILGVCVGGDRVTSYMHSKEQLLRTLDDKNQNATLARLESEIMEHSNRLGIGPMGFGGVTTLLACKIGALNRVPASFFVSISYMCWADRRQGAELNVNGKMERWLY
jgi:fumarate hydratase class I